MRVLSIIAVQCDAHYHTLHTSKDKNNAKGLKMNLRILNSFLASKNMHLRLIEKKTRGL